MSKVRRKITKYEIILCVLVLAVIVAGLLLPKSCPRNHQDPVFSDRVFSVVYADLITKMPSSKGYKTTFSRKHTVYGDTHSQILF